MKNLPGRKWWEFEWNYRSKIWKGRSAEWHPDTTAARGELTARGLKLPTTWRVLLPRPWPIPTPGRGAADFPTRKFSFHPRPHPTLTVGTTLSSSSQSLGPFRPSWSFEPLTPLLYGPIPINMSVSLGYKSLLFPYCTLYLIPLFTCSPLVHLSPHFWTAYFILDPAPPRSKSSLLVCLLFSILFVYLIIGFVLSFEFFTVFLRFVYFC